MNHLHRVCYVSETKKTSAGIFMDWFCFTSYFTGMENIPRDPDLQQNPRENIPEATVDSSPPKSRQRWIRSIILIALGLLFLFYFPVIRETYFRCAICGMNHTEKRVTAFGWLISSWEQPTESSDWYQANVEPEHQHTWVRTCFSQQKNCFGQVVLMQQLTSLASGPFSWLFLGDYRHIELYKRSPDPAQARALLLKLAYFEPEGSPERKVQDEIFSRFREWRSNGIPGPWPFDEGEFLSPDQPTTPDNHPSSQD
ncbi:hypothetical protein [Gimesia sp.]|uniref:hypothetical protein n=1 Tax=Gimesia sp. TaxID=2024833 RepID=UPI003A8E1673